MLFWIVSLPLNNGRKERTWDTLLERTTVGTNLSSNYKLEVPELRVGTLDTLMAMSDDLGKISNSFDAIVGKIRRTVMDISPPQVLANLKVENKKYDDYITHFRWDEAKFPSRRPLKETVEKLTEIMSRIEDELKVKQSEYNATKSVYSAATRKAGGSLAVRDINGLVKKEQVVDSENLTTLFVIVGKYGLKEWQEQYEKLCDFVVPRSSKTVAEDSDYVLCSVILFRRVIDDFKAAARTKGYQVREWAPPSESATPAASTDQLKRDTESKRSSLEQWSKTAFGEAFVCYMHLIVVRLFVESILRYGLPPQFLSAVLKPEDKMENRLRNVLNETFGLGGTYWKDDGGVPVAGLASDGELFPYVSFSLTVD